MVTSGHQRATRTAFGLGACRSTPCLKRPVTKLLASPVTVWNRRRCLRLAQRGQCPSDKPVGDHGGSLACSGRVSLIRGRHVSGMRSSKQKVRPYFASHEILTARNAGCTKTPLPPDSLDRVPGRQCHLLVRVMAKRQDVQVTPTPKW